MKKGKWILIGVLCLVLVLAAVFGPGIYRGAKMYGMIRTLWTQEEASFDIRADGAANIRLDWRETDLGRVLILENSGVRVCYHGGAVYLENGKGYDFSQTAAAVEEALQQLWKFYPLVKTTRQGESWTASLDDVTVTLEQGELGFALARVKYDGMEFEISPRQDRAVLSVPDEVLTAISAGKTQGGDLTKAFLRLFAAWANLAGKDSMALDLSLRADCGPLNLADTLQVYRDRESGIGYVEKNARGLYFSRNKICTADGKLVTGSESTVESAQLLGVAYLLLLNGDFTCEDDTYRLTLDQVGMESFAYTIAPAAENLNIAFQSGEILLKLRGNELQSLSVSCTGTLDLILTKVDVSVGADLTLKETGEFTIPQGVMDALS